MAHRPRYRMATVLAGLFITLWQGLPAAEFTPEQAATAILQQSGIAGGLVVHLGCGDGRLTAALAQRNPFLVHGLERDAQHVAEARQHIRAASLYGRVSIDKLTGERLPYADNLVNLLVVEEPASERSHAEFDRVLCPGGVALLKESAGWKKIVKPWPQEIDEWTHFLHGPDNNAVANDTVVGPPHHLQWIGGPKWARGHEVLATISAVVTSGGRIFYIADEGETASLDLPSKWTLVARDAFNGVLLWKRSIPNWESRHRPFRSGPTHLPRRLTAIGETVYVTLGLNQPVVALDAATGETRRTYEGTEGTEEILYERGTLYLVAGEPHAQEEADKAVRRGEPIPRVDKRILALQAESGRVLWEKEDDDTADQFAQTLAISDGRVFFQNTRAVLCLNATTGDVLWSAPRPTSTQRPAWSVPTLVVYGDVLLSADRAAPKDVSEPTGPQSVQWTVSFQGGKSPPGELVAFSTKTGERLWSCPCREGYNSPVDVLLADGLLWTGDLVKASDPGITEARDPITGEIKRRRPNDQQFFTPGMSHHRCYRNRATDRFVLLGRSGIELVDLKTGQAEANHWVRGTCQFGVMPANGLLYAPSHTCACYVKTKLNGFNALAPKRATEPVPQPHLERGPAYEAAGRMKDTSTASGEDWPTYRHDAARSGATQTRVPVKLERAWRTDLGGQLTSPVVAEGRLLVARADHHTLYALDANSGEVTWSYTAGGKIDSPPTIHRGLALFGSADGWLYCLRMSDGELAWRYRAGPEDRRIVVDGSLESTWPLHGSVLVQNDRVYFCAGRSSFLDGGIYLIALDPLTGNVLSESRLSGRDPATGQQPKEIIKGFDMPTGLPDVLSGDGEFVFMRDLKFDAQCARHDDGAMHLFSPTGFLDDSWWHRSYWVWGSQFKSGFGGWHQVGNQVPAGRLLAFNDDAIYGFGRNFYPGGNAGQWKRGEYYRMFAAGKNLLAPAPVPSDKARRRGQNRTPESLVDYRWMRKIEPEVRAMVLAGEILFVAGPLGETHRLQQAFEGREGIRLQALSTTEGEKLADYELDSLPVFDGMAAAHGRLFLSTKDGHVSSYTR